MRISGMNKKEIIELSKTLPVSKVDENSGCDSILIIPTRRKHDSGYNCIIVIGCKEGEAICKITSSSDVLGFYSGRTGAFDKAIRMDCLPNGILQIWSTGNIVSSAPMLSSIDFYINSK